MLPDKMCDARQQVPWRVPRGTCHNLKYNTKHLYVEVLSTTLNTMLAKQ